MDKDKIRNTIREEIPIIGILRSPCPRHLIVNTKDRGKPKIISRFRIPGIYLLLFFPSPRLSLLV